MKPLPYAIALNQESYNYLLILGFNRMPYIERALKLNTLLGCYLLPSNSGSGDIILYAVPPCDVISLEEYREKIFINMLEE